MRWDKRESKWTFHSKRDFKNGYSSAKTEVWKLENSDNKTISPALPPGNYMYGVGINAVDFNFCQ